MVSPKFDLIDSFSSAFTVTDKNSSDFNSVFFEQLNKMKQINKSLNIFIVLVQRGGSMVTNGPRLGRRS